MKNKFFQIALGFVVALCLFRCGPMDEAFEGAGEALHLETNSESVNARRGKAAHGNSLTFNITASVGPGGDITSPGVSMVPYGWNKTYLMTPHPGYRISQILIDGVSIPIVGGYVFQNVTANHTIRANFSPLPQTDDLPLVLTGTPPESKTMILELDSIPRNAAIANITLRVHDADRPTEGEISINELGTVPLFGAQGVPGNDLRSVTLNPISAPASFFHAGDNFLTFRHLNTAGFTIEAVSVTFDSGTGSTPTPTPTPYDECEVFPQNCVTPTPTQPPTGDCDYIINPGESVNKYSSVAGPGERVCFRAGVHRGALEPQRNGIDGQPIIYSAEPSSVCQDINGYKNCSTVLSGSKAVTGPWTRCTSQSDCGNNPLWANIYYADLPTDWVHSISKDWLYQDGKRMRYASEPDQTNTYFTWNRYFGAASMTSTSLTMKSADLSSVPGFTVNGYVKMRDESSSKYYRKLTSMNQGTLTWSGGVDVGSIGGTDGTPMAYILLNHISLLDQPGEFVIDYERPIKRLYMMAWDSLSPQNHLTEISVESNGVNLDQMKFVHIEGLEFRHFRNEVIYISASGANNAEGLEIKNNYIFHNGDGEGLGAGTAFHARGLPNVRNPGNLFGNIKATNNEIYGNGHDAFWVGGGATIKGNRVHYNGGDGVHTGGVNTWVEGNLFYDSVHTDGHQDSIDLYMTPGNLNWVIRNNIFADYTQHLYMGHCCGGSAGQGVVSYNIEISGNIVFSDKYYLQGGEAPAVFIVPSAGSTVSDIRIHSNVFAFVGYGVRIYDSGNSQIRDITLRDNIFYQCPLDIDLGNPGSGGVDSDYNLFYTQTNAPNPTGGHYGPDRRQSGSNVTDGGHSRSITSSQSLFVNYPFFADSFDDFDFRLRTSYTGGNPAINTGDPNLDDVFALPNPFIDLWGNRRPSGGTYDIGAHELVP